MILSKKTMLIIHTGLSALWTWAVAEGLTKRHLLREIPRPRPEKHAVTPFTEQDIKTLLAACDRSKPYDRPGKKTYLSLADADLENAHKRASPVEKWRL